jgi:hypothetical protein
MHIRPAYRRSLRLPSILRSLVLALVVVSKLAHAEPENDEEEDGDDDGPVPLAEAIEGSTTLPGLFTLYRHEKTGRLLFAVRADQLGRDFIYCSFVADGLAEAGYFRGEFRDNRIVRFRRHFDRIEIVAPNLAFHFDPTSPLARAAEANRPPAVLAVVPIEGEDAATGTVVIDGDALFLTEALARISPYVSPDAEESDPHRFTVGEIDPDRTRLTTVRNYPANTDILVDYVLHDPAPMVGGGDDVTDPRYVTASLQHTFLEAPTSDYQPRESSPVVGYFATERTDLTSTDAAPYRDLIHRWHLVKREPDAPLSEPVEPITFWIENTTPHELRDHVREGVLAWNTAFEAAGFKNALVVHVQPDDATWDAGDIRYNVLRWVSSPQPQFGGYGPSFVDPRTGRILGADIMLEFVYVTNRLIEENTVARSAPASPRARRHMCSLGLRRQADLVAGRALARAMGLGPAAERRLLREAIVELVMHEVGHTLGLQHNMRASHFHDATAVHDAGLTSRLGLSASVMDYNGINLAPDGTPQGQYFTDRPGPYDIWAIQFGYTPSLSAPAAEHERVARLLERADEPGLAFGNDADDMRFPGAGIDPRVMIDDLSADPLRYGDQRLATLTRLLQSLADRSDRGELAMNELFVSFRSVWRKIHDTAESISRFVGGVYVDHPADSRLSASTPVLAPVPSATQREALAILERHIFAPDALNMPPRLLANLQLQRRGFRAYGSTQDPKIHAEIAALHARLLDHLLHPAVLARITDARTYGGGLTVAELASDLSAACFHADSRGPVPPSRQHLQAAYVDRLSAILEPDKTPDCDPLTRAAARQELADLLELLASAPASDRETTAHRNMLIHKIRTAFRADSPSA